MCFKKKQETAEKVKRDREKISSNSKFIQSVLAKCAEQSDYVERLNDVEEKLKYLIPSHKSEIFDYELAIEKRIVDLNRTLSNRVTVQNKEIDDFICDINSLIADRNTNL